MYGKEIPTDHNDGGEAVVRRVGLLLVMMTVALILSSGVALAGYFVGTRGDDKLKGTSKSDEMYGLRGDDRLEGRGNNDEIYGGAGRDRIFGDEGDDYINSADKNRVDNVDCGGGTNDRAVVDDEDNVVPLASCEVLTIVS
jgi:hypothetical protein